MKKKQFMPELKKFTFIFFALFILKSCSDPCNDIICLNDADCLDGFCICQDFYQGPDCGIEERSLYLGKYVGTTTYTDSQGNSNTYADSKEVTSSNKGVNYLKLDNEIFALLSSPGSGVFNIPSQTPSSPLLSDSYFLGSGNFNSNILNFSISIENNGEIVTMTFSGSK